MSRDQTSDRCATIVWTQCCVERSQNLTKVSFPEVNRYPGAVEVDVEGRSREDDKKWMFVIWSRWPRNLRYLNSISFKGKLVSFWPIKTSFPNNIPHNEVSILWTRCKSSSLFVKSKRGNSLLVPIKSGHDGLCRGIPESDRTIGITNSKDIRLRGSLNTGNLGTMPSLVPHGKLYEISPQNSNHANPYHFPLLNVPYQYIFQSRDICKLSVENRVWWWATDQSKCLQINWEGATTAFNLCSIPE